MESEGKEIAMSKYLSHPALCRALYKALEDMRAKNKEYGEGIKTLRSFDIPGAPPDPEHREQEIQYQGILQGINICLDILTERLKTAAVVEVDEDEEEIEH
jgi:hypothetical protein